MLKPISYEDLKEAINRYQERKDQEKQTEINYETIKAIFKQQANAESIGISTKDGIEFIKLKETIYCESARNYTIIHLENTPPLVASKTLGDFEELLSKDTFCRVHKSYIININHVKKYIKGRGGVLIMSHGSEVDVSRERKELLVSMLKIK